MSKSILNRRFAAHVQENGLIESGSSVVAGVSGGPDSMALLHLLYQLRQYAELPFDLHVAHLDHRIRGFEAEKDAAFVQAAADGLGLPCTIERYDVVASVQQRGGSLEEIARVHRYEFLERVALKQGASCVAVGHHADDNAETILHRILRGTGLRGLAGIPRSRAISPASEIRLIRPLLDFGREELIQFLRDSGVPYREDRTNQSNEAMRNRIRNQVLPLIEAQVNPQVREALLRLGEQANWLEELLTEMVHKTYESLIITHTDQELVLNAHALSKRSRIVQTELIRRAIASFQLGDQDIGFTQLVAVLDLLEDPASGKEIHLSGGMVVSKRYDQIIFSVPTDEPREAIASEVAVHVPGTTILPVRRMRIACELVDVDYADVIHYRSSRRQPARGGPVRVGSYPGRTSNEEWVDYDVLRLPLVVRKREPGDRFWPLGAPGSKKLSEFLAGAKVDPRERDRTAVICDQLGPVWVIGHRIDERVKLTRQTRRALKLRAEPVGD